MELSAVRRDRRHAQLARGIGGIRRFLGRVWDLVVTHTGRLVDGPPPLDAQRTLHRTIHAVTQDLENLRYNTAVAALMSYLNTLHERESLHDEEVAGLLLLLAPFAPHLAEELWGRLVDKPYSIHQQQFPKSGPLERAGKFLDRQAVEQAFRLLIMETADHETGS